MNFNISIDPSNYKPFTFLDLIAPMLLHKLETDKQLDKLEKYAAEYGLINPEIFKDAAAKLEINDYNLLLRLLSDSLATGSSLYSTNKLATLLTKGTAALKKYKDAVTSYNKAINWLNQLGPDAIMGQDLSPDAFLNGLEPRIRYASRKDVRTQGAALGQGLNNLLTDSSGNTDVQTLEKLKDMYLTVIRNNSFTALDFDNLFKENGHLSSAAQLFKGMMDSLLSPYSSANGFSQSSRDLIRAEMILGGLSAMNRPEVQQVQDLEGAADRELTSYKDKLEASLENDMTRWDKVNEGKLPPISSSSSRDLYFLVLDDRSIPINSTQFNAGKKGELFYSPQTKNFCLITREATTDFKGTTTYLYVYGSLPVNIVTDPSTNLRSTKIGNDTYYQIDPGMVRYTPGGSAPTSIPAQETSGSSTGDDDGNKGGAEGTEGDNSFEEGENNDDLHPNLKEVPLERENKTAE